MSNTNSSFRTSAADGAKQSEALSAAEMDRVVAGQAAPTGTAGGGNVSIWSWIKGQVFGVEPSFFS
jgi:hypothetical protein